MVRCDEGCGESEAIEQPNCSVCAEVSRCCCCRAQGKGMEYLPFAFAELRVGGNLSIKHLMYLGHGVQERYILGVDISDFSEVIGSGILQFSSSKSSYQALLNLHFFG